MNRFIYALTPVFRIINAGGFEYVYEFLLGILNPVTALNKEWNNGSNTENHFMK